MLQIKQFNLNYLSMMEIDWLIMPYTKSLAQILSRDIGFDHTVTRQKGHFKTIAQTLKLAVIQL